MLKQLIFYTNSYIVLTPFNIEDLTTYLDFASIYDILQFCIV